MKEIINYSDIDLNFFPHPLTGNVSPKINIESMRQSIKVLFLLNPFDVPFDQSDFVNLKNFLFENMNHLTASNLVKRVEWAIQSFEKRVEFISAKVTPYESDDGFEVSVTYRIKIIDVIDTFIQQFQKIR
jgi:hypothetical protein